MNVTFVYLPGRLSRMDLPRESVPTEFFYGALEMRQRGHTVALVESCAAESPGLGERMAHQFISHRWLPPKSHPGSIASVRRLMPRLIQSEVVVATTPDIAFAAAFWQLLGPRKVPLVAIQCGILNYDVRPVQRWWAQVLMRRMYSQLFGPGELRGIQELYAVPADRVEVNLFGVDAEFWRPLPEPAERGYVLAVGNDSMRDYDTLIAAAGRIDQRIIIITQRPLPEPLPPNVEVIRGSWHSAELDDPGLRTLYAGATCVVVPLKPGLQPSGQSVTLQAMACGRPVILTRIDGLWDGEHLRHGENLVCVPPGDPVALADAVRNLKENPELRQRVGEAGRRYVLAHGTIQGFADRIEKLCERVRRLPQQAKGGPTT